MDFIQLESESIPKISLGTSPFIGAGQFGQLGQIWRLEFLHNAEKMAKLMIKCYENGAKGVEAIPAGRILDAISLAKGIYPDFTVLSSTLWESPANHYLIDKLVAADAKIIFLHGSISDQRDINLIKPLISRIRDAGKIPGIATHYPHRTIPFIHNTKLDCPAILLPFNIKGQFMGEQTTVEQLVDSLDYFFVAMKPLAAGKIPPKKAFPYLREHNISAVTVGMVSEEEIIETIAEAKKIF
jgi:hypothetical protein